MISHGKFVTSGRFHWSDHVQAPALTSCYLVWVRKKSCDFRTTHPPRPPADADFVILYSTTCVLAYDCVEMRTDYVGCEQIRVQCMRISRKMTES